MKKLLMLLVVLGFLKGEVKAQAVEWVRPIEGKGSTEYINDSLIYVTSFKDCYGQFVTYPCISNLNIYNSNGVLIKSKVLPTPLKVSSNMWGRFEPQQKFNLENGKVLYSVSNVIIDQNLDIATVPLPAFLFSNGLNITKDFEFVTTDYLNNGSLKFTNINSNGSITGSNLIVKDRCFYNSDCSVGYPFIDSNNIIYWSRCSYEKINNYSDCNKPLNYLPTNTVGGVLTTYANKLIAAQQSVMSFDKNSNVRFLPFYESTVNSFILPTNFQSDGKGNLFILSFNGLLAKYSVNPWDSIWTKQLNITGSQSQISLDGNGNIYVSGSAKSGYPNNAWNLYVLDTLGNTISKKQFPNISLPNFQTDNKNSIYIATDTAIGIKTKILDCYTITSNVIAKLYTGTLPGTPKLTQSGLVLKSNFPRGVTWYRNDSLLTSENDTFTLALRDGKYTFKAFCKQDTLNFKGISYPNGALKTISIPGASYQWSLNDVPIPNAITNTYSPTSVGKYTVRINFDKNQALFSSGRASSTNSYQAVYSLNLVQLSVDNDDSQTPSGYFSLYPNPATQTLTIKTAGFAQMPQALILNALGQEVTSLSLPSELSSVDVSAFPKGIYSIKVGSQVQKLVVE